MECKGIEYQIVQTANPSGWKWTVFLDATRMRTGESHNRSLATIEALHAIDKAIKQAKWQNLDKSK
jgi:ABC-type branched-subunit amino acid transport system substrate-binding protein